MRLLDRLRRRDTAPGARPTVPTVPTLPTLPTVPTAGPSGPSVGRPEVTAAHERRWTHISVDDGPRHPGLIERIVARDEDGLTVSGVFTAEECARIVENIDRVPAVWTPSPIGTVLGMPLGDIGPTSTDRSRYCDDADAARAAYLDIFGFDPHERVAAAIAPMTSAARLIPASEDGRDYNAGHLRQFTPGSGGLRAHAGNEFREIQLRGAMSHLVETTRVTDHLSYFVVVQRPEIGGSLSVYDLLWFDEFVAESPFTGDRDDSAFDDVPHLDVDPEPGGLVVFTGGRRWHRIEPVEGSRPRVTYGGFLAPAVDGDDFHFWT